MSFFYSQILKTFIVQRLPFNLRAVLLADGVGFSNKHRIIERFHTLASDLEVRAF